MASGIGLYLNKNRVIAAKVCGSKAKPEFKQFADVPILREGSDPLAASVKPKSKSTPTAQAIRKALKQIGIGTNFVVGCVDPEHAVTRFFSMHAMGVKERDEAIQYETMRFCPFRMSEVVINYRQHPEKEFQGFITSTAVRKRGVQSVVMQIAKAGVGIEEIETLPDALGRLLKVTGYIKPEMSQGIVFVGESCDVHLNFFKGQVIRLTRDFSLSGIMDNDRHQLFDEIKASLDYHAKVAGGEIPKEIFILGFGDIEAWTDFLNTAFKGRATFLAPEFSLVGAPVEEFHSGGVVAIGMAMRCLFKEQPFGIKKLLPKENRRLKPAVFFSFLGFEMLAVIVLMVLIQIYGFGPIGRQYQEMKSAFDEKLASMPGQAIRTLQELQIQKNALVLKVEKMEYFMLSRMPADKILSEIALTIPKSAWIDDLQILKADEKGPDLLSIKGICYEGNYQKESNAINEWIGKFGEKEVIRKHFKKLELQELRQEKIFSKYATRFRVQSVQEDEKNRAHRQA